MFVTLIMLMQYPGKPAQLLVVIGHVTQCLVWCRFWKGLLAVWVGGALGQPLAFLLAR